MKRILVIVFALISVSVFGQKDPNEQAKPIVEEGKRLYRSEMASWYGTDLFLAKYKNRENLGGYFSYSENDTTICVYFSNSERPRIIGTIAFDSTFNTKTATTDLTERDFTMYESDIYQIRNIALANINSDSIFKNYNNTNLNLIPLIYGGEKKVYVLTGPTQNGVVIFGNDYLLTFDKNNNLTGKKQLHQNIIPIEYGGKELEGVDVAATVHSHLEETGDFITATDICTLMLYSKFAGWKQHNVVSKNYLNSWNCITNELAIIPMKTIKKINKKIQKEERKSKRD